MKTIVRIVYYGYGESNTYIALYEYLKKKHDDLITQDAYHFSCSQGNFELLSGRDLDEIKQILLRGQADMAFVPFANSDSGIVPQIRNFYVHLLMRLLICKPVRLFFMHTCINLIKA